MGTESTVDAEIPTTTSTEDKNVDLATPSGEETWEQLSDMRLFILGAAFFALWAGNVRYLVSSTLFRCKADVV